MTNEQIAFSADLQTRLLRTFSLLASANLRLHPRVTKVTLHGSRGLRGGCRPDSDIDLSLLTNTEGIAGREELGRVLRGVMETTLSNWQGLIEPDLVAVFDLKGCSLGCFDREAYDETLCQAEGIECFGVYKIQKGFSGFRPRTRVSVKKMYPCLVIWRRPDSGGPAVDRTNYLTNQ